MDSFIDSHMRPSHTTLTQANDVPGIRQTLANGSLWLHSMPGELFRQEIHSTSVNCLAENEIGAILSRDIQIMAGNVDRLFD